MILRQAPAPLPDHACQGHDFPRHQEQNHIASGQAQAKGWEQDQKRGGVQGLITPGSGQHNEPAHHLNQEDHQGFRSVDPEDDSAHGQCPAHVHSPGTFEHESDGGTAGEQDTCQAD